MNPYTILQDTEMFDNGKPMAKIIGNNIRTIRLKKRLTQEHVAEHSGIHYKYLQEVEAGRKTPGVAVVQKISAALGVPLCQIVSVNGCPCSDAGLMEDVARLFRGKEAKEIKKAIEILCIFFK